MDDYSTSNPYLSRLRGSLFKNKRRLIKIGVILAVLFVLYGIYRAIIATPNYSAQATATNGARLEQLLATAGPFQQPLANAVQVLQNYPGFYAKVANNVSELRFEHRCPYLCILQEVQLSKPWDTIWGVPYQGVIPLLINPDGLKSFPTSYDLAAALVHEADHVEFLRSSRLRKLALTLHCNPLINLRISIDSNLPSLVHRLSPMEICAEKQEIAFHQASNTASGYEFKRGLIYNFSRAMFASGKFMISVFKAIF